MRKEYLGLTHGARGFWVLLLTTGLAMGAVFAIIGPYWQELTVDHEAVTLFSRRLVLLLFGMEACCVALIAPALAANAITREREQHTLEALLLTRLSSTGIVLGKWLLPVALISLVVLAALPVAAVAFLLGGTSPGQLAGAAVMIVAMAALLQAVGLYLSTLLPRTNVATTLAYLACVPWVFFMPGVTAVQNFSSSMDELIPQLTVGIAVVLAPLCSLLCVWLTATPMALLLRRKTSRAFRVLLFLTYLCFFALLCYTGTLIIPHGLRELCRLSGDYPEYVLLGNPLGGLVHQLGAWDLIWSDWTYLPWTIRWYTPLAITLHLMLTALFLRLSVRRLTRMRRRPE